MSYDDAAKYLIDLYEKETDPEKKELLKFEWGMDFGAPHEAELTKLNEKPVFVYGYPSAVKAFYNPTISGTMVARRDQVLMTRLLRDYCATCSFLKSWPSI